MIHHNTPDFRLKLRHFPALLGKPHFVVDDAVYLKTLAECRRQHPEETEADLGARAIYRCVTLDQGPAPIVSSTPDLKLVEKELELARLQIGCLPTKADLKQAVKWVILAMLAAVFILAASGVVFGQAQNTTRAIVVATCGTPPSGYPAAGGQAPLVVDVNGNMCSGVSVSATIATAGLAISVSVGASTSGVPVTPSGGMASTAAPSWTTGTVVPFSFELDGDLRVAASVTPAANQVVSTILNSASGTVAITGSASDGTTATFSPIRVAGKDGTGAVQDILTSPTGAVVIDSAGSSIPISGTVTVTDGAGALNTIVDSGTLTAVTTITNAVTVTDGSGALNVIVDSGTITGITNTVTINTTNLATSALQTTGNTSLSTIAGAVAGTEMQVDVLTLPSVTIGTFPDNEPFNVAQWGGSAVVAAATAGIGNVAPAQVVTTSSIAYAANRTAGAYVSTIVNTSGSMIVTQADCGDASHALTAVISTSTSGNVEIIPLTAGQQIVVCGYDFIAGGTVDVQLIRGTGSACGTGETDITGAYQLVAQTGLVRNNAGAPQAVLPVGSALCIELSGAISVQGMVTYIKR